MEQTYHLDKSESIDLSSVEFPSFETPEKVPLGTNREITQPPPEDLQNDSLFLRLKKWQRLSTRRLILPTKEANFCHRGMVPVIGPDGLRTSRREVDILKNKNDRFGYRGLFTCGNIWLCPVCASKISEKRRIELNQSLRVADEKGMSVIHEILTAPHHLGEGPKELVEKMGHARRLMQNRKPWKRIAAFLGIDGNIRALEVTFSWNNGWHVHFHVLLFLNRKFQPETRKQSLINLEDMIFDIWRDACLSAGLDAPSREHGVRLNDHADDYVGKWGSEHEMTKAHIKEGHKDSLSPFQFLDEFRAGDDRYRGLFLEYAKAFKGKKQLVWSRGLRDLLKLEPEMSDEEIMEKEDPDSVLFAQIPAEVWSEVAKREKMGEVLEVCRRGEQALSDYLNNLIAEVKSEKA